MVTITKLKLDLPSGEDRVEHFQRVTGQRFGDVAVHCSL